ncbi:MAG: methyltransferase [Tidjanibacter sp.]|nr:methyltransferase [Tidjanibacter sp.]
MSADFRFKQFNITQKLSAMKVGTDGVLLGAWVRLNEGHRRILDIGCGTGLVALMVAQRTNEWGAEVVGVEIDSPSATEAANNFAASPWSDRLSVVECAVQEYHTDTPFDHIVSNPPYFVNSLLSPDEARTNARHTTTLTFDALAHSAVRLLSDEGLLSVVLPCDVASDMVLASARCGLFLTRRMDVRSKATNAPIRVLLEFGRRAVPTERTELTIHSPEGPFGYSPDYVTLTKDFYLKF